MKKLILCCFMLILLSVSAIAMQLSPEVKVYNKNHISKVGIEKSISFNEKINSSKSIVELQNAIKFNENKVYINSYKYPELNKPALIKFRQAYNKPQVFYNDVWQPNIKPTYSKSEWNINVPGFSEWSLFDTNFSEGSFDNVTIYNSSLVGLKPKSIFLYDFNRSTYDNSIIYDRSYYNSNGTRKINYISSLWNTSLYFDDTNDLFIIDNKDDTIGLNDFSVSFWFKSDDTSNNYNSIFSRRLNSTNGITIYNYQGKILSCFYIGIESCNNAYPAPVSNVVADDTWHMVTVVYDRDGNLSTFINNSLVATMSQFSLYNKTSINNDIEIGIGGTYIGYYGGFYKGEIDNLVMYDRLITETEIDTLYVNSTSFKKVHNVISNGDFESDTNGWTNTGKMSRTKSYVNGNNQYYVTMSPTADWEVFAFLDDQVQKNKSYQISFDSKVGSGTWYFRCEAGSELLTYTTASWISYAGNFTPVDNTCHFLAQTGGTTVSVDDIVVTENYYQPTDSSGNNNHGNTTKSFSPKLQQKECVIGSCLDFDGINDFIGTKFDLGDYMVTENYTIMYWMKLENNDYDQIIGLNNEFLMRYDRANAYFYTYLYDQAGGGQNINSNVFYPAYKWVHVAVSVDNTNNHLYYYINGTTFGDGAITVSALKDNNGNEWRLGDGAWDGSNDLNGTLDEFKIINKFMNESEVNSIFSLESSGSRNTSIESLLLEWRFDDSYLAENLLGYYEFNDNSPTNIENTYGILNSGNLTDHNAPVIDENNCLYGNCLYFNDSYASSTTSTLYRDNSTNLTVSFWIKPEYLQYDHSDWFYQQVPLTYGDDLSNNQGYIIMLIGHATPTTANTRLRLYIGSETLDWYGVPNNDWTHVSVQKNGYNHSLFINGVYEDSVERNINFSDTMKIGAYGEATKFFIGYIDEIKVHDNALLDSEINSIYSDNTNYKFYKHGHFISKTLNFTEYDPQIEVNSWRYMVIQEDDKVSNVYGKSGDCNNISDYSWLEATSNGNGNYSWNTMFGTCFNYRILLTDNGNDYDYIDDINVYSFKYKIPQLSNATIYSSFNYTHMFWNDTAVGTVKLHLNDTDSSEVQFTWYVNNEVRKIELISNVYNGTVVLSNYSYTDLTFEDIINFTVLPSSNFIYGDSIDSNTLIVSNSNFTMSGFYPPFDNLTMLRPSDRFFGFDLQDPDNDVNCTWTINNIDYLSGERVSIMTTLLNVGGGQIIKVTCQDKDSIQDKQWIINVEQSEYEPVINFLMWIFLIIALFYYFIIRRNDELIGSILIFAVCTLATIFTTSAVSHVFAIMGGVFFLYQAIKILNKYVG